ncbi:T9SS type A sorting domain-containing protein, partial [Candidatus Poribacteria bacterium]|nr:T9SS type A sorting domain-containing protein [Candidatus Poribacteria bacterium]
LWVTVPGELDDGGRAHLSNMDLLAAASNNSVTELEIATYGATVGKAVGDSTWIAGELDGEERDNINTMLRTLGLNPPEHPPYVVYGSITLYSPRKQDTKMFVGSDMSSKIWLNGTLIRKNGGSYVDQDYQTFFPVTLKAGKNALLVAIDNTDGDSWSGYFGFAPGTEYTVSNSGIGYSLSQTAIHIGDTFTVQLNAENISDLAGWQFDIVFDPTVLEAVEINEGDFLKTGDGTTFFQKGTIDNTTGKITKLSSARLSEDGVSGKGTLLSVTFRAKTTGQTQLKLDNFQLAAITGASIPVTPHEIAIIVEGRLATGDVNRDGQVSILDMVLVARHFGKTVPPDSDVDLNGDGVVNIQDLILVAQHLGESTLSAAPSMTGEELNPAMIQAWIAQAQVENDGSIAFQQGIANLQRLLALLIPEETALLPNYPNPFNPETWIPYQLAEPVEVTLKIYAVNGTLVRTLALGQMPAGMYQSRARAAYWNGKNDVGESVANGVYFYSFTAGEFTSTRKMLIRK